VVRVAGGWLFDQVLAGWDVTAITASPGDGRSLSILGARACDLESALAHPLQGPRLRAIAVQTELYDSDERVRRMILAAVESNEAEVRLWGETWPEDFDARADLVWHRLSAAARAFKAQALAAIAPAPVANGASPATGTPLTDGTEVFRRAALRRPALV
jgi:hypothetical protein